MIFSVLGGGLGRNPKNDEYPVTRGSVLHIKICIFQTPKEILLQLLLKDSKRCATMCLNSVICYLNPRCQLEAFHLSYF